MDVWIIGIFVALVCLIISRKKSTTTNKVDTIFYIFCVEAFVFLIAYFFTYNERYKEAWFILLFLEGLILVTKRVTRKKNKN
ncbi:hypothetical protein [Clostridium akagii]|uniref:hypothetical protein n=1 Tax=Clostridium akagii TaxID=91623 RepID=UPI000479C749|nr:hypothetical protein [Clostridium akagii]